MEATVMTRAKGIRRHFSLILAVGLMLAFLAECAFARPSRDKHTTTEPTQTLANRLKHLVKGGGVLVHRRLGAPSFDK